MVKAILMDVGRTIVTNRIIDFKKGLEAVYQLDKRIDKCDLNEYFRVFKALWRVTFDSVRVINSEVKIGDFLQVLNEITGIVVPDKYDDKNELEYYFQCNLIEEELMDGVEKFLDYCKSNNLPVLCVSNSCMTSNAIKREFKEFNIDNYIVDVISSADILVRKPRKEIFDYAYGKILRIDDKIKRSEVLFIGDNFECDVVGSCNAGLCSVWLNHKQEKVANNSFSFINVKDYDELIDVLKVMK